VSSSCGLQTNETCFFVSADNLKLVNSKVVAIKGHGVSGRDRSSHQGSGA